MENFSIAHFLNVPYFRQCRFLNLYLLSEWVNLIFVMVLSSIIEFQSLTVLCLILDFDQAYTIMIIKRQENERIIMGSQFDCTNINSYCTNYNLYLKRQGSQGIHSWLVQAVLTTVVANRGLFRGF